MDDGMTTDEALAARLQNAAMKHERQLLSIRRTFDFKDCPAIHHFVEAQQLRAVHSLVDSVVQAALCGPVSLSSYPVGLTGEAGPFGPCRFPPLGHAGRAVDVTSLLIASVSDSRRQLGKRTALHS
eukprot:Skav224702  [mRNA]  locus=scaffold699:165287:166473:+ [translate_table: standard]